MCLFTVFLYPVSSHPLIHKVLENRETISLTYHFLPITCKNTWPTTNIYRLTHRGLLYLSNNSFYSLGFVKIAN